VAAESILDKAVGLIPGVGTPKRRKPPTGPQAQLATLKRNLSKLARDVDKLGKLIVSSQKKKLAPRVATAKHDRRFLPGRELCRNLGDAVD